MELKKGLIQVYTGNGKGKTTAALGQALRSIGCGLKVYMVQFLKSSDTGELHSVERLYPDFQIFRFERTRSFFWTLSDLEKIELKEDIKKAFEFCSKVSQAGECDILILDEIMGAIKNELLSVNEILYLINNKHEKLEIIMTGREVPTKIAEAADLITDMKEVKHYYKDGIVQRKGIEY
jgi:cob(I)alamin adenosyltransferase